MYNSQNIIIGGAQVPIVIFILSLMVVCKIIALKDGIMHNHWGSISVDVISQRFTKLEHFTFLLILSQDVIEAAWYFSNSIFFSNTILNTFCFKDILET